MELALLYKEMQLLKTERDRISGELSMTLNGRLNFPLGWSKFYIDKVEINLQESKQINQKIDDLSNRIEIKRKELLDISRQREAIESLRARRLLEHRRVERRKEQLRMDEIFRNLEKSKGLTG